MILSGLALLPPLFVMVDVRVFHDSMMEVSLTEMAQAAVLGFAAAVFGCRAHKNLNTRGFELLVSGFFTCMLIREMDGLLDLIRHGFWFWPALWVALGVVGYVGMACRTSVLKPMAAFIGQKSYYHIVFGLLVVLVFSRVFGSGRFWAGLLEMDSGRLFKASLQEGLELLGYVWIGYGSAWYWMRDGHHPSGDGPAKGERISTPQMKGEIAFTNGGTRRR